MDNRNGVPELVNRNNWRTEISDPVLVVDPINLNIGTSGRNQWTDRSGSY